MAAEVEVASSTTACLRLRKVGCVAVNLEAHVARMIANGGFGFGGAVIEELGDGLGFGLGVLGGSQGTKGDKHRGVDGASVIQERAHNFLGAGDFWGVKRICGVSRNGELLFGTIGGCNPGVGSMLVSVGLGMLESVEGSSDVTRKGHVDNSLGVVPLEGETTVETAGPIGGDRVLGSKAV